MCKILWQDPMPITPVREVVPFLSVSGMERSLRYYVDGLDFKSKNQWVVDGQVRWCRLALGGAALMLQEFRQEGRNSWKPQGKVGDGVSLWFQCEDAIALYDEFKRREVEASEPQVGNAMWVTTLEDPDGYRLHFVSTTDTPEDTKLSAVRRNSTA